MEPRKTGRAWKEMKRDEEHEEREWWSTGHQKWKKGTKKRANEGGSGKRDGVKRWKNRFGQETIKGGVCVQAYFFRM